MDNKKDLVEIPEVIKKSIEIVCVNTVDEVLKQALTIIKDPELNTSQALEKIENGIAITEEISYLIDFVRKSSRGVTK